MINSLKIKEIYNKRAALYDKLLSKLRYHTTLKSILGLIKLEIPQNAKILDMGCGTGLATEVLIKRFISSKITGLDCSEEMLSLYQKKFPDVNVIIGDFNKKQNFSLFVSRKPIFIEPNSFDLIVSTGAVSEYGNVEKVIPFIYSILKNKGIFINIGIKKNVMSLVTGKIWHYKAVGKKEFISVCKNNGFSKIYSMKISWNHFPTNITKFAIKTEK